MPTPVTTIIRKATRKDSEPLNVLCMPTHERYESSLAMTNHNFYAWRTLDGSIKDWDTTYAPLPNNYTLLDPYRGNNQLPDWLDVDIVLSQNKFGQFPIAYQISQQLGVPLISLEHTLPVPTWDTSQLINMKRMRGNINVFISEFSREAWGWEEHEARVIHHGIDTHTFSPAKETKRENVILSVNNDFINREWCLNFSGWKRIVQGLPVLPVGKTPGLSEPAKDIPDLVNKYRSCLVYLNTTTYSPIPTSLLESMACECAPVSTATCLIPDVIKNGVNGFISNDESELRKYCQMLLNNPGLANEIGKKARETILEKFSLENFVKNWNDIFYEVAN